MVIANKVWRSICSDILKPPCHISETISRYSVSRTTSSFLKVN